MKPLRLDDAKKFASGCFVDARSGSRRLETVAVLLPTQFGAAFMEVEMEWFLVLVVFVLVVAFTFS